MKKIKVIAILIAITMLSVLVACGGQQTEKSNQSTGKDATKTETAKTDSTAKPEATKTDTQGKKLVVAFAQTGNQNTWKITQTNSIKEEAKKRGIELIYTDAQDDTAKQISDVEDIISKKPNYIILSPREYDGVTPALKAAKDAGIPVILVDRGAAGTAGVDYKTLICADFIWEGKTDAEYLAKKFEGNKRCNIVELTGTPGSSVAKDRGQGFKDGIAQFPNMKIIASQVGNFDRATSQKAMENIIQANSGKIDAVFAHNDDNAIGAIQALKAAGLKPGKDVIVVSVDGQKDALKAIVSGELLMTVQCSPRFGESSFGAIDKIEKGEQIPGFIKNPGKVYDISNAEKLMDEAF